MRVFVAAAALAAVATSAVAQDAMKVCVEGAYPPFSETTPDGELIGFDIDITNALCEKMGRECELVQTEWDGIIPALQEGKCDAIIASMSITEDRKKVIDFTDKYYYTPARLIGPEDSDLEDTPEGLADKVVGVQRGTIHQDYMESEFPDTELKLYGTQDEAYLDLQAGRVDAVMADSVAMDYGFLRTDEGEGYDFVGRDHYNPEYHGPGAGIGIRQGEEELKAEINQAIDAIREDGTYKEIQDKYFDFDVYGEPGT